MLSSILDQQLARCITQDLGCAEPDLREIALDRLGSLSGDHVEIISGRLADPDPEVRGSAAINLGRVRRPSAWPLLIRALGAESSEEVQRHIVAALALYHDGAILTRLLELLTRRGSDYRVRMEVAVQLWKYHPGVVGPVLVDLLRNDDNDIVRIHAAEALKLFDEIDAVEQAHHELWLELAKGDSAELASVAERALRRGGAEPAADVLALVVHRLRHPAADERSLALYRLSLLAPGPAVLLAQPLLHDERSEVRAACCECLGRVRDDAAIPLLLTVLRTDPTPQVNVAALIGLENYHAPEIGSTLLEQLETGTYTGQSLSSLCRQVWKYPSARSVALLRRTLASQAEIPHRSSVEGALAFLERFSSIAEEWDEA